MNPFAGWWWRLDGSCARRTGSKQSGANMVFVVVVVVVFVAVVVVELVQRDGFWNARALDGHVVGVIGVGKQD